mgnify:CR=1 FL=1
MNAVRAKNGYLVGFEDMEDNIVEMIRTAHRNSYDTMERFDLMRTEFCDLKKEVGVQVDARMDKVRFETKGVLQQ